MGKMHVKLEGMKELQKKLSKNITMEDVKTVVRVRGAELQREITRGTKAAYTKGYSEGYTADSVSGQLLDGGLTYETGLGMAYDPYVEYGTRHMEAEPVVTPAAEAAGRKFIGDLRRLMR